ncbi:hypothetical protein [Stygiolobus caldivivus]|uniref:Uncharacterized protein n=1 Tax=Stygiolobus caldivivus TaxID=2824673 RepID=A0A8D5U4N9_9CREN|nr:hypothetical protein [Stygiolobus caldivivus]BCU69038.1 hypothetical protein KN1_03350 [Stygiolobus caldivivus]
MKLVPLILIILILSVSILYLVPDNNQFSPYNKGPLGLSILFSIVHNISNSNTVLLLVFYPNLKQLSSLNILGFLEEGKTVVIAGNYTLLNTVFKKFNLPIIFGNIIITSNTHYYMDTDYLLFSYKNWTLLFPYPHPIIGGNPMIKFSNQVLVSCLKVSNGKLIVISSPYIFINKFITAFDNEEFIASILGDNSTIIIVYHNTEFDYVKGIISKL